MHPSCGMGAATCQILKLASEVRSTSYTNFGICPQPSGAGCPFGNEPGFKDHPQTDITYPILPVMARAIAEIAVGHAADSAKTKARHMLHDTRKKGDDPQCAIQTALLNICGYISDCSRMN